MNEASGSFGGNITLWCAALAWCVAQTLKMVNHFITARKVDFWVLVSLGGMPSAHSAMVSALAASVGLRAGFDSPLFAATAVFALVVMFDAQSVRRAAGKQARLLNQMVEELLKEHHLSEHKLVELLGHTPLEVFFGCLLGIFMTLCLHGYWG
ncbi:MAG: divergent PAP2 family protein [Verrucomicrobia bacterium]|nr:divergent PAP2 family protein [Verrucomicrobiota bacterium]